MSKTSHRPFTFHQVRLFILFIFYFEGKTIQRDVILDVNVPQTTPPFKIKIQWFNPSSRAPTSLPDSCPYTCNSWAYTVVKNRPLCVGPPRTNQWAGSVADRNQACILAYLHTCILAHLHTCTLAYQTSNKAAPTPQVWQRPVWIRWRT